MVLSVAMQPEDRLLEVLSGGQSLASVSLTSILLVGVMKNGLRFEAEVWPRVKRSSEYPRFHSACW